MRIRARRSYYASVLLKRMTRTSHCADFKHLAVIAGLSRDPKLTAAIEFRHDRHHGDDRLAFAVIQCGLHAWLLAEPDQIARGRKRQFEPSALAAGQRL